MKTFRYRAKRGPAEVKQGVLAAATRDEAIDQINEMGLIPIDVTEELRTVAALPTSSVRTTARIGGKDLISFYRQLARLVKSGIPILKALTFICEQAERPHVKKMMEAIRDQVGEGQTLSSALEKHPKTFSAFDVAVIQAGEHIGKLNESLARIAEHKTNEQILLSKLRTATAYPLFVFVMGVATTGFMLAYVIPQFTRFFSELGQNLPLATRILIDVSHWVQTNGWVVILVVLACLALGRYVLARPSERKWWDRVLLSLPIVGNVQLKIELTRFARTLEFLLKSGIQLLSAIQISVNILQNQALRSELEKCLPLIREGGYLSQGLRQSKLIPPFFQQVVHNGEESGHLGDALTDMAEWYEQETGESIRVLTALLEPAIILTVGLMLGVMVIAVLLPVFDMNMAVR